MGRFVLRRFVSGIFVVFVVITVTFFLARVVPSDPALKWVGVHATDEQREEAIRQLGLDKPLMEQYFRYLSDLTHGNFGVSILTHRPVADELRIAIPNTLELVFSSVAVALAVGLVLGVYSATRENTWFDHGARFISVSVISIPGFWLALMLQILFSSRLRLLPLTGQIDTIIRLTSPVERVTGLPMFDAAITANWAALGSLARHYVLPVLTLSLFNLGLTARMTRSMLLEVLNEDYIRASRAYGIKERLVIWRYAMKNVAGTVVTVMALSAGYALVGTFVTESVFGWPGVGSYVAAAVVSLDYPAIIGVTIFSSIAYVLLNLIADIIVALDPRVRLVEGG